MMSNIMIVSKLAEIADKMPSLRDQIAMAALQGILSNQDVPINSVTEEVIASLAYSQAEAMLLAREREE